MNNNILVRNLRQLSAKQWRRFLDFIESPYFNQHLDTTKLAHYLYQQQANWMDEKLDRKVVFLHCFPNQVFNLQKLKDLFSKVHKQFRHFVQIEYFEKQKDWQQSALIQGALDMGLKTMWQQQNKAFEATPANAISAYKIWEVEKNQILQLGDRKTAQAVLEKQTQWLYFFYWKEKLRLSIEQISIAKVMSQNLQEQAFDILEFLPDTLLKNKTIYRYRLTLEMLQQDYPKSAAVFDQLLDSIKENDFSTCTPEECYSFYVFGLNYCTARINSGDSAYYQSLFNIYELLDLHGRLIQNETLSQWSFLNMVATACNLNKFEWAKNFIQNYLPYIPADQQENVLVYNLALLSFYQKQFDQTIEHLHKVTFTDPYYSLNSRVLELRVFYEKQEWIVLDSLFERFRIYLLRNKDLPKQRKQGSLHFLKILKSLSSLSQHVGSKKSLEKEVDFLHKKIEQSKWLMHRAWLREMGELLL